jgi:hypothetical protein
MKNTFSHQKTSQRKNAPAAQRAPSGAGPDGASVAPPNRTGLPDTLKTGVESLSGLSLDDVKVHYNSSKPANLQALAYTQGTDIHVAPGEERHLPHEAWHVVQQKQGRVKATMQMAGQPVNDNAGLEREADALGSKALSQSIQRKSEKPDRFVTGIAPSAIQTKPKKPNLASEGAKLPSVPPPPPPPRKPAKEPKKPKPKPKPEKRG